MGFFHLLKPLLSFLLLSSTRVLVGVIAIVLFCLPLLDRDRENRAGRQHCFLPGNDNNVSSASIKDIDPKDPPSNLPNNRTGTTILLQVPLD